MGVPVHLHHHSFKDYLAVEQISTVRHEYLAGEIYAMAGGSLLHAAPSVLASLHGQLGGRCRVYSSDLRIRLLATGLASYPDVAVVCGPAETDPEAGSCTWRVETTGQPHGVARVEALRCEIDLDALYVDAGA